MSSFGFKNCALILTIITSIYFRDIFTSNGLQDILAGVQETSCSSGCYSRPKNFLNFTEIVESFAKPGLVERPETFTPPWFNSTLYKIGQKFAQRNIALIAGCHYVGAVLLACGQEAGKIILGTRKSHTKEKATPRYLATARQIILWYDHEMEVGKESIVATSLANVRSIHEAVNSAYLESPEDHYSSSFNISHDKTLALDEEFWTAVTLDLNDSRIPEYYRLYDKESFSKPDLFKFPMNQFLLGMTQYLFVGIPFVMTDIFVILNPTEEQMLGWHHLWAVLGYAMGIEDQYNIALKPSVSEMRDFHIELFQRWIIPGLFQLRHESKVLVEILLKIQDLVLPSFNYFSWKMIMTIILQETLGIPMPNLIAQLSFLEKIKLYGFSLFRAISKFQPNALRDLQNNYVRNTLDANGRIFFRDVAKSDADIAKYMYY